MYSGKKCLYSGKSGNIRAKWLYWGKSCCIRAKVVVFGIGECVRAKSGCTREKVVVSGKVVLFGKKWSIRTMELYSGKSGFIWEKVVVLG